MLKSTSPHFFSLISRYGYNFAILLSLLIPVHTKALTIEENAPGFCAYNGSIQSIYTGATNNSYVNLSNETGKGITWAISVAQAGNYSVQLRYANAGTQSATQAALRVNGVVVAHALPFPKTPNWNTWTNSTALTINLNKGNNVIRLETTAKTEFANIDSLTVHGSGVTVGACAGAGSPKTPNGGIISQPQRPELAETPSPAAGIDMIKAIQGNLDVNSHGQATYSIPILTAAGTAGLVPKLRISYNSGAGNGLMGLGWSLNAGGEISRCRQTEGQDKNAMPITWSSQDRFCLNGERLIVISGSYGAPGSVYKTEIDNHARITSIGGTAGHPDHFKVEHKDGQTSYFGKNDHSQSIAHHKLAQNKTLSWLLTVEQDSAGNKIRYYYQQPGNTTSEKPLLASIKYAYGTSVASHAAEITFNWEDRSDRNQQYVGGLLTRQNYILDLISVYNQNQFLRSYRFAYNEGDVYTLGDNISRLSHIYECSETTCLVPTSFEWSYQDVSGFRSVGSPQLTVFGLIKSRAWGDINGDGILDLAWRDSGGIKYALGSMTSQGDFQYAHETFENGELAIALGSYEGGLGNGVYFIDYNADGYQDLIAHARNETKIYLSKPQANGRWKLSSSSIVSFPHVSVAPLFMDFNGDGLQDYIDLNSHKVRYLKADGTGFSNAIDMRFTLPSTMDASCSVISKLRDETGDFNGDGRVDFIALVGACMPGGLMRYEYHLFTSHLASTSQIELRHFDKLSDLYSDTLQNSHDYETEAMAGIFRVVDINADGLSDVIVSMSQRFNDKPRHLQPGYPDTPGPYEIGYFLKDDSTFQAYRLSTGTGLSNKVDFPASWAPDSKLTSFVDFNGDGYTDIVTAIHTGIGSGVTEVRRWNSSTNSFQNIKTVLSTPLSIAGQDGVSYQDLNGDGAPEYILSGGMYSPNAEKIYVLNNKHNLKGGSLITRISNGLGQETQINYQNLLHSKHYARIKGVSSAVWEPVCQPTDMGNVCWSRHVAYANATNFYNAVKNPFSNSPSGHQSINSPPLHKVFDGMSGMNLVTSVSQTAPSGNPNSAGQVSGTSMIKSSYYYEHMRYQAAGRGFLGFEGVTKIDHQTGIRSVKEYRQDWPFNGLVLFSGTYSHAGATLSTSESSFGLANCHDSSGNPNASCVSNMRTQAAINGTAALGATQPIIKRRITERSALKNNGDTQGDLISTTLESFHYDTKGNLLELATETHSDFDIESISNKVTNIYDYSATTWSMQQGRLRRSISTSTNNRYGSLSRTSEFDYYQSGSEIGLLKTEIVEPDNLDFTVATTHSYHLGNRVSSSITADGQTRLTEIEYDSLGRYVDKTYGFFTNGVDVNIPIRHVATQVMTRDRYGTPTLSRSYHSPSAFTSHKTATSSFGTPYFSATSKGEFTEIQMGLGTDAYGVCPSDANSWSLARMAGGKMEIQCLDLLGRVRREGSRSFNGYDWSLVDTEYDKLGRVIHSSTPYSSDTSNQYWKSYEYDILGRITATRSPYKDNYVTTTTEYENLNKVFTNPAGQVRVEKHDSAGRVIEVIDPNNGATTFAYDARGNLREMKDPAQNTTIIGYDLRNRKISMSDPDKGNWSYQYNRFNELTCQRDAKNQTISMVYDIRGRMVRRMERLSGASCDSASAKSTTFWVYDTASNGLGQLESVYTSPVNNPVFRQRLKYDSLGRLSTKETSFSGHLGVPTTHNEKITYDQYNRVYQQFDAARAVDSFETNGVQYVYNERGYLQKVVDAVKYNGIQQSYYTTNQVDARGNISSALYGNGITQTATYEPETGLAKRLISNRIYPSSALQDQSLDWDAVGNLVSRHEIGTAGQPASRDILETFSYDSLNRLDTWISSGEISASESVSYDAIDNIRNKSGIGSYLYGSQCGSFSNAGPHAACRAGTINYNYDKNGNLINDGSGRILQYTIYDLPSLISKGGHRTEFFYDPNRARYKRVDKNSIGQTITTLTIGSVEKVYYPDGSMEWKRTIAGVGQITQTMNSQGVITGEAQRYFIKDHLGSISLITDEIGAVEQTNYYDPWGKERKIASAASIKQWLADNTSFRIFNKPITSRGFTGHEHIAEVGLIHMNGRIYDATIARFVQADPIIQNPLRVQSLNRYSYVWNNPLNATDPSGFIRDPEEENPAEKIDQHGDVVDSASGDCGTSCDAKLVKTSDNSISAASTSNSSNTGSTGERSDSRTSAASGTAAPSEETNGPTQWVDSDKTENMLVVGKSKDALPMRGFRAPTSGRIELSRWEANNPNNKGHGYYITLRATNETLFLFSHLDPDLLAVDRGDTVSEGQFLGQYGDPATGGATGPHLHVEWWKDKMGGERLDPKKHLETIMPSYEETDFIRQREPHPISGTPKFHNGYDIVDRR